MRGKLRETLLFTSFLDYLVGTQSHNFEGVKCLVQSLEGWFHELVDVHPFILFEFIDWLGNFCVLGPCGFM